MMMPTTMMKGAMEENSEGPPWQRSHSHEYSESVQNFFDSVVGWMMMSLSLHPIVSVQRLLPDYRHDHHLAQVVESCSRAHVRDAVDVYWTWMHASM